MMTFGSPKLSTDLASLFTQAVTWQLKSLLAEPPI